MSAASADTQPAPPGTLASAREQHGEAASGTLPAARSDLGSIDLGSIAHGDPRIARLVKIRVPVITQLAARRMPIASIRKLSVGTILEFEKQIDQPLELLINNQCIAYGEAVKVGERFGLLLNAINDRAARIRSLGK